MLFRSYLGCIESVGRLMDSATAGNVQKSNTYLTIGQVKRILAQLVKDEFLEAENVPYGRTGKIVYRPTNKCACLLSITSASVNVSIEAMGTINA